MPDLKDKEFAIATGVLEDCRRYIAAQKAQRWDVVKWSVSVNLALATAGATSALAHVRLYLLILSCGVAFASWRLVLHYNKRMTGTRIQAAGIVKWLKLNGIDYDAIVDSSTAAEYARGESYDLQELAYFLAILVASPILILLSIFFLRPSP